jgi:type I restriction enzyme S subunit
VRNEWSTKPFGEVCPVSNRKLSAYEGERRYFATGAVGSEGALSAPEFVDFISRPSRADCMPEINDIGFARMKGTKKVILVDESLNGALFSTGFCFVVPQSCIEPRFAFHFIASDRFQVTKDAAAGDGIMGGVKNSDVAAIRIPLPSITEQKRVVHILDRAFEGLSIARTNAYTNIHRVHAMFDSYLQSALSVRRDGWKSLKFAEVCMFSQGIQVDVKLQSESRKNETQVRFLRIVDFTQGNEPPRYIDNPGSKFMVSASDISLVRYGASTGFVCSGLVGAIANNLFRVVPNRNLLKTDYLLWFLRSPLFQDEIKQKMNGAAMPAISFGMINGINFPLPQINDQAKLAGDLNELAQEIQQLESIYQRKLIALDDLKKSLLHQAFSGQL